MRKHKSKGVIAALVALSFVAVACGSDETSSDTTAAPAEETTAPQETTAPEETTAPADTTAPTDTMAMGDCAELTPVKLQLQWVTQAQFAGYYAAVEEGFYEAMCLDVTILEGAVDITPQTVLANGDADFAISWVPKALASREAGADIVDIAQVFQRSGTLQVSFADAGIASPADFAGRKIGNWGFGNESINPDTGELYTPEDFSVISYEDEGVGMLQDAIWADGTRLSDEAYNATAISFVAASLQGWAYCRDNVEACATLVTEQGSALGLTHQTWQMNEINKLIWPAEGGVGTIDTAAWDRTAKISQETKNLEGSTVLTAAPDAEAYTNDIVTAAHALLEAMGIDINGADYAPIEVTLTEGGV